MNAIGARLRKVGVGADIGLTVVLQVISAVAAFAFQAKFLRALSPEDSGLYFLAISYITIGAGLGDFGIAAAVFPRLSVARGEIPPAFRAALVLRTFTLVASMVVLNLYLMARGKWDLLPLFNVGALSVFISGKATGLRQLVEMIWRMRGRTYVVTLLAVIDSVIALAAVVIMAMAGRLTLYWLMIIFTASSIPGCIAVVLPMIPQMRASEAFRIHIPRRYYIALLTASLPVAAMIVLGQTSAQLETLVIDSYTAMSHADIASYNAAVRPLTGLIFVATTLGFGLAPLISQHARGVRSDYSLSFIVSLAVRLVGVISLGLCLVCGLFGEQVMGVFGKEYVNDAYILRIFSVISALTFTVVVFDQFLLALGKRKQTLMGATLNLGLALLTEPITIRMWGIRGMMYSKGLALCCLILFQLTRMKPEARVAAWKGLLRLIPSAAVLLAALLFTVNYALPVRAVIAAVALLGMLLLMKTVRLEELRTLRRLRVS
ncbi:MAG: hypothetical protein JST22_16260 [Bacteroidetes bacterium]|nr:hypothetical protein [Bacteroidota bacterium]